MNKYIRYIIIFTLLILPAIYLKGASKGDKNHNVWTSNQRKAEYMFLEGVKKKTEGKIDSFYELTRRAHFLDPNNSTISFYLGYCYIITSNKDDQERIAEAVRLMRKHVDENPSDYFETSFYADVTNKVGLSDESLRVLKTLSELYPKNNDLRYQLADGYLNAGEYDEAIKAYDIIESIHGITPALALRKFNIHFAKKDTTKAFEECYKLLKTAPDNIKYNLLLGDIYLQVGKPDSAISIYNKVEKIDPENGFVNLSKAEYYTHIGDSANYENQIYKALINQNLVVDNKLSILTDYIRKRVQENDSSERVDNLFKVLITQHPHEIPIHQLYSKYLLAKKDFVAAAEQLSYVLDIDPTNAEEWKKLMFINLLNNNFPKALEAAQKSLEYNPDNIELYQYIAPAYFQMKEYDKAFEVYNDALSKTDSTNVELRSNLYSGIADIYYAKKDTINAFKTYEKALEIYPNNAIVLNNYAYHLAVTNSDLNKAERLSALAVKIEPNYATYLDTYAWVFFRKGDYKLAKFYIESALENSDAPSAEIIEHYGDILFMTGEPDKAVEQWIKAQEINPDSELLNRKVKNKTYFYK